MNNRRQNKLKKNPLVRFLRIVYKSFKIIFRKKPDPRIIEERRRAHEALNAQKALEARLVQEALDAQKALDERRAQEALDARKALEARQQEIEQRQREQYITVGELLERVKWQLPKAKVVEVSTPSEYDVSLN
jgi:beta-phosphoglucomutase-like phosphatase (HAD superfamily)